MYKFERYELEGLTVYFLLCLSLLGLGLVPSTRSTRSVRRAVLPPKRVLVRRLILGLGLTYRRDSGRSVAEP